jgi:hypothetical protein
MHLSGVTCPDIKAWTFLVDHKMQLQAGPGKEVFAN